MDRIKESFDSLPTAVCFFDKNGIVRLVNHQMLAVMNYLRPDGVQTLTEMEAALSSPLDGISCVNMPLQIYYFPDGRSLRFTQEQITTKEGTQYTQVTAADVTELMRQQAELNDENSRLSQTNDRLRHLFENMPEIIREEETLQMKLRIHDDMGHSLLASRRAMLESANLEDIQATAKLWEQSIAVLYRSNQIREESDSLETAIDKASKMGVHVFTEGTIPYAPDIQPLIALSVTECATNCVRHAGGTELYVKFSHSECGLELSLTNNGTKPHEQIREGGGLSMLRRRVEKSGGCMEISSNPCFKLSIILPQKEVTLYESNDC